MKSIYYLYLIFPNLSRLELHTELNALNSLSNIDPDLNIPQQVNFKYYTAQDFVSDNQLRVCTSGKHFSALHANIRSLNANFDKLVDLLSLVKHKFTIIGLTETKRQASRVNIVDTSIPGYNFISLPSLLNSGGVGFYISNDINVSYREDLSKNSNDFEALWIEMQSDLQHNIVCGVVYRHPNSNINSFMEYINATTDLISKSNKYCVIMGDFNINLLNAETHSATDDFLNNMGSYFFLRTSSNQQELRIIRRLS